MWYRFLKNGYLDCPDPKDSPASFLVQNEWFDLSEKGGEIRRRKRIGMPGTIWACATFARDLYEDALNAFETSMALEQSTWGYHGLANVWRVLGMSTAAPT